MTTYPAHLRLPRYRELNFIDSRKKAEKHLNKLWSTRKENKPTGVDSEFNSDDSIEIWSMSQGKGDRHVIHGELLPLFADWFAHKTTKCVYQNYKADRSVFSKALTPSAVDASFYADIMVLHHNLHPNDKRHGLKYQGVAELGWHRKEYQQLFCYNPQGKSRAVAMSPREILHNLPEDALEKLSREQWFHLFTSYAADDAEETIMLFQKYRRELDAYGYWSVYCDPIIGDRQWTMTLMAMQARGIHIDQKRLTLISKKVERAHMHALRRFKLLCGKPNINVRSNVQLHNLIFKELGWPTRPDYMTKPSKKNPKGNPQLNAAALTWYVEDYGFDLAIALQGEKSTRTLMQTLTGLQNGLTRDNDGNTIVYTDLNQTAANTGRISSRKQIKEIVEEYLTKRGLHRTRVRRIKVGMQLQNMPVRKEKDPYGMRSVFIAVAGEVIICCDYAGFELVMAVVWASRLVPDSKMLRIMKKYGTPSMLHAQAAIDMFDLRCDITEVKSRYPDEYSNGKRGNFNLLYGGMAKMFCKICGWDIRDRRNIRRAEILIRKWFAAWPEIKVYQDWCDSFALKNGYIEDISGQRFDLTEYLNSSDEGMRMHGLRKAKNTPCQASAAKIVRAAGNLIELDDELRRLGYVQRLHVHDEILGTCPSTGNKADYALERKIMLMKKAGTLYKVKPAFQLSVDGKIANNWLEAKG